MKSFRNIFFVLALILLFPNVSFAYSDWENSYIKFVEESSNYKNHFKYNAGSMRVYIYDLDNDGIPEMILESGELDNFSYNIYTLDKKRVRRIYGEINVPNNSFLLSLDGKKLFRTYFNDRESGFDGLEKTRNRVRLNELAYSEESKLGRLGRKKYRDSDGNPISKDDYELLTKGVSLQGYSIEDIDLAIGKYKDTRDDGINIILNGDPLSKDMPVINKAGSTYYPFRALIEGAGGSVKWNAKKRQAEGRLEGEDIVFPIDLNIYRLNGVERSLSEDKLTFLYKGRTYIPIRDFMESIGFDVDWDKETKTILLSK